MRLPVDLVAYAIAFLDYAADSDALAAFRDCSIRTHVDRVWLRYTRVERGESKRDNVSCTWVNGMLHSLNDEPAITYTLTLDRVPITVREWRRNGQLHRDGDAPAVEHGDGSRMWYKRGAAHRDGDRPAIIKPNGVCMWYKNGVLHRDDDEPAIMHVERVVTDRGPAQYVVHKLAWYQCGVLHRDVDAPAIINAIRRVEWYKHGVTHRDGDSPAIIDVDKKIKEWYRNGRLHRDGDAPAYISRNSRFWYKHGNVQRDGDKPSGIQCTPDGVRPMQHNILLQYFSYGLAHRDGNRPAQIRSNGMCHWYYRGTYCREASDRDLATAEIAAHYDHCADSEMTFEDAEPWIAQLERYRKWYVENVRLLTSCDEI